MKKLLPIILTLPLCIHAAMEDPDSDDHMLISKQGDRMFAQEMKTTNKAVTKDITKQEYAKLKQNRAQMQKKTQEAEQKVAASVMPHGSSDVMIVDPNVMATDWVNAFDALNKKRLNGITFVLKDQTSISNVSSLEAMPGGYLILFTQSTVQGIKYRIIKTSEISSLETR